MPKYQEVLEEPGRTKVMLGNAAIARGFLEAGLQYAASYPGTPSTEITEALEYASSKLGWPYVEWSVNEKVALESAAGVALAGLRAFSGMKHVGLNVAADPFFSIAYLGIEGALVVVSADDPWMWSSQNEQDNRIYGVHAYVPVIEPKGAQEAKEAARLSLDWSARFKRPILLRITTRIAHTRVPISLGSLRKPENAPSFQKNPRRYTLIPEFAREHRIRLLEDWERIRKEFSDFPLNTIEMNGSIAVVASGIGYRYAKEAINELEADVTLFGVSTPVPMPSKFLEKLTEYDEIIVVEEGEPVVEGQIRSFLQASDSNARIYGKMDGSLRVYGELDLSEVRELIGKVLNIKVEKRRAGAIQLNIPPRPPTLCAGCPYRSYFYALKRVINRNRVNPIYSGDIGCYSLGISPPFEVQDIILDMGASISTGGGIAKAFEGDQKTVVVSIIGDSTFFHSGVESLINVVYNQIPLLVIILDNFTTAMTGHQPHPGIGGLVGKLERKRIDIEKVVRGIGVEEVEVVDAFDIKNSEEGTERALKYVLEHRKPAVVVARGACALVALAEARRSGMDVPKYVVDESKCTACGICYTAFNCPAILKNEDGKAWIDPSLCIGCGQCEQVCPFGAFVPTFKNEKWDQLLRTAKPR